MLARGRRKLLDDLSALHLDGGSDAVRSACEADLRACETRLEALDLTVDQFWTEERPRPRS